MQLLRFAAIALLPCGSFGQQAAPPKTFEVASIRQGGSLTTFTGEPRRTGGRLTWTTTLYFLTCYAYRLPVWRISGVKSEQSFYTIAATMDPGSTEDEVRAMLRQLLRERFNLSVHTETKELSGYALAAGPGGSKLRTTGPGGEAPPMPDYLRGKSPEAYEGRIFASIEGANTSAITGRGVSTSKLADAISEALGVFVEDRTGLTGNYYFGFRFRSEDSFAAGNVDVPTVFAAVQEELGLKLEKQRGPVEILVVDRIDKIPSEN